MKFFNQQKQNNKLIKNVTFFGGAEVINTSAPDELYDDVIYMAEEIAKLGVGVVNGGGPGVMRASTEGAKKANGFVTGVTLQFVDNVSHKFEGQDSLNKFDKEVKTTNYFDRTKKLLDLGDVHIVIKGGTGTFSEFAMAWEVAYLHYGHNKPLILYGSQWNNFLESLSNAFMLRHDEYRVYKVIEKKEDVIEYIKSLEGVSKMWQ